MSDRDAGPKTSSRAIKTSARHNDVANEIETTSAWSVVSAPKYENAVVNDKYSDRRNSKECMTLAGNDTIENTKKDFWISTACIFVVQWRKDHCLVMARSHSGRQFRRRVLR